MCTRARARGRRLRRAAPFRIAVVARSAPLDGPLPRARHIDEERRAVARLSVDLDRTAVLLHDPVHRGEPEAGALSASFVVKNGSKMRAAVSASMPVPLSLTAIWYAGLSPGGPAFDIDDLARSDLAPDGIASRALTIRLTRICSTCVRSAMGRCATPGSAHLNSMCSPMSRSSMFCMLSTT